MIGLIMASTIMLADGAGQVSTEPVGQPVPVSVPVSADTANPSHSNEGCWLSDPNLPGGKFATDCFTMVWDLAGNQSMVWRESNLCADGTLGWWDYQGWAHCDDPVIDGHMPSDQPDFTPSPIETPTPITETPVTPTTAPTSTVAPAQTSHLQQVTPSTVTQTVPRQRPKVVSQTVVGVTGPDFFQRAGNRAPWLKAANL